MPPLGTLLGGPGRLGVEYVLRRRVCSSRGSSLREIHMLVGAQGAMDPPVCGKDEADQVQDRCEENVGRDLRRSRDGKYLRKVFLWDFGVYES